MIPLSALDAVPFPVAVLDGNATVLTVNEAWRGFGTAAAPILIGAAPGADYLAVCGEAAESGCEGAEELAAGIRSVLDGSHTRFSLEFRYSSTGRRRWFSGHAAWFGGAEPLRVLVSHQDITAARTGDLARSRAALLSEVVATQHEIVSAKLDLTRVMRVIAERAQELTRGSGAVLEMIEGDEMVYRAAAGSAAQQIGQRLKIYSSLSGLCVRSDTLLHCDDAENDERVNRDFCRRFGVRSLLVAPLHHEHRTVGVLKVMAADPGHFTQEDVQTLQLLAGLMGSSVGHAMAYEENQRLLSERTQAMEALRLSEERFRSAVDNSPIGLALVGLDGRWIRVNRSLTGMVGYTERNLLETSVQAITHPEDLVEDREQFLRLISGKISSSQMEKRFLHKKGYPVWVLQSNSLVRGAEGVPLYFISQIVDLTEQKRVQAALERESDAVQLLRSVAFAANEASRVEDAIQLALNQICSFAGWAVGHAFLLERGPEGTVFVSSRLWHLEDPSRFEEFRSMTEKLRLEAGASLPGAVAATGKPVWIRQLENDSRFARTELARRAGIQSVCAFPVLAGHDVTAVLEFFSREIAEPDHHLLEIMSQVGTLLGRVVERRWAEETLRRDALHDSLTGLANRAAFMEALKRAIARVRRRPGYTFAVLFLDLDRFKVINDSLGHIAGDSLLVEVATRLQNCVRPCDIVARLGGDEFTVLLDDINDRSDCADSTKVAERILAELARPFRIGRQDVYTAASIGIALSTSGYKAPGDILRDADNAMYRAKSGGRGRYELFDRVMHERAISLLHLETDLRKALEREEFALVYQPIVALPERRIVGFEALIRWNHPERGMVSPADFIPMAEETGLIVPIGNWVLREACRWMQGWQMKESASRRLTVSVNVSGRQFAQPEFVEQIASVLSETGLSPHALKLEITESTVMEHAETATELLARLKALSVQLQVDDFGTGYSSLAYLHRFPIDALKIDRSFVHGMESPGGGGEIIRAVIALASALGKDVVAEGVETHEQVEKLLSLGCKLVQGFYFSPPVDSRTARELVLGGLPRD